MRAVYYSPLALQDLQDIALYIAADNPDRALSFVDELRDKAKRIAEQPEAYPSRDELIPGLRGANHGRYILFYFFRVIENCIHVERVLHSARDVSTIIGSGNNR